MEGWGLRDRLSRGGKHYFRQVHQANKGKIAFFQALGHQNIQVSISRSHSRVRAVLKQPTATDFRASDFGGGGVWGCEPRMDCGMNAVAAL